MYAHGKQLRKLVDAGLDVFPHEFPSCPTHDKYTLIDGSLTMEGSVNWSGNAMTIPGKVTITDDMRHVSSLIEAFGKALMECAYLSKEDVAGFPKCSKCTPRS